MTIVRLWLHIYVDYTNAGGKKCFKQHGVGSLNMHWAGLQY